jgi:transposase
MKTYRPWEPERTYLLPPSTQDWLPDDHLAFFILDVLDQLDLRAIENVLQEKDPRGEKAYSPRMMTALLLYAYSIGVYSSRGIVQATWTDMGARVIAAESHPHFTTVNQFRLDHRGALAGLFVQVLRLCDQAGLVALGHVAVDGTKIQANASKHKAMSYDRMKETEKRLQDEVEALLAKAEAADRADDERYGADKEGPDIPDELRRRETRRARLQAAKAGLEREAAAARKMELEAQARRAEDSASRTEDPNEAATLHRRAAARRSAASKLADVGPADVPGATDGLPFHTVQHEKDGTPKPKAQRNFTDPESRIMAMNGGFIQAYNGQIAVDEKHQIIVAQLVTNQGPDPEHLEPALRQVHANLGSFPEKATADAGYWSEMNAQFCQEARIDAYISTRRTKHADPDSEATLSAPIPANANTEAGRAMESKVCGPAGRLIYARRKWTVEPVFGQTKEVRGFRRFSLRGLGKVRAEFAIVCTTHNLLKLWRNAAK